MVEADMIKISPDVPQALTIVISIKVKQITRHCL